MFQRQRFLLNNVNSAKISSMIKIPEYLTFDDVLLLPQYSEVLPAEVFTASRFSKNIKLNIPISSSAMDTVTESKMAIALARLGGIGVIHKNLSVNEQSGEVKKVKSYKVIKLSSQDKQSAILDKTGRLVVVAAVGAAGDFFERAAALVKAGADGLVVDTAHGHSKRVIEAIAKLKKTFSQTDIVAGNVATTAGALALIRAGADGVKVGIGPGSICTTRVVSGCGAPQMSAILDCAAVCRKAKAPLIADGGIKYSGDLVKALAAGADCVMLGSLLAGTDEAPGEIIHRDGKKFKAYRGMGSLGAMQQGSKDRYGQESLAVSKLVPEGVEAVVLYKGVVEPIVMQLIGGLKSGMGYCGASDIYELQRRAKFARVTSAGLKESHPHSISISKQPPNYHLE